MEQIKQLKQEISHIENNLRTFAEGLTGDDIADNYYQCVQMPEFEQELMFAKASLLDAYMSNPQISNMLKIAEIQCQLTELGFEYGPKREGDYAVISFMFHDKYGIAISFYVERLFGNDLGRFYYNSPTVVYDVITKVEELLNASH